MAEQCLLYDKTCTNCGECDMCDMDPDKLCNNCGTCLESASEYRSLNLKDFIVKKKNTEENDK